MDQLILRIILKYFSTDVTPPIIEFNHNYLKSVIIKMNQYV